MPPRRAYESPGRQEGAARNRAAVLAASRELLLRDGYRGMTVRSVAERAGVSAETVYKTFGSKPGLLKALWDVTLAADDEPIAMADRPQLRQVWATSQPTLKLRRYAAFVRGVNQRVATLFDLLSQSGPEVADMLATTEHERLTGLRAFVAHVADAGLLAADRDPQAAADACWALTGPRLFHELCADRGWDAERYESWLTRMLAANLYEPS